MSWWHSAVVYQIYPRSFADSNGDGVGDLPGIISRIDYLAELGVDVVWLSPVYRSPMKDNGYDVSDYYEIDPLFGTMDDFDALVAALHQRGMKLVMDLVVNHTSDAHPWFQRSRDPGSGKRDWYIWRPARPGTVPGTPGAEPTNAGSAFVGPGWEFDEVSGQYYFHLFSPHQPDLNWENPDVRQAIYQMMRWWVDRGVDGFRMDVINVISKSYPPADGPTGPDGLCYEVSMVANGPRMHEFLQEMNREVGLSQRALLSIGEMVAIDAELARGYTAESAKELDMVFTFEHVSVDQASDLKWDLAEFDMPTLRSVLADYQNAMADEGWNALYFENHDQPRSVSRFGDDSAAFRVASAKTLATCLHMQKGTPFVYQGEELGMTNAGFTRIEQYNDVESLRFYQLAIAMGLPAHVALMAIAAKSRDNARTPIAWDGTDAAGFTTGVPWLPINANHDQINVAAGLEDPDSVYHHYRKLIALRHVHEVVRRGRFQLLEPDNEQLFCFSRTLGSEQLLVVANWSSEPVALPGSLPSVADAPMLLGTHDAAGTTLAPWESRVYRLS